jgi:2-methylisocitrate lyase-like PEP mutase family enzyme
MVELFGFPSLYIGSSGMAEFHGEPGWNLTSMTERVEFAGHIAKNVDIPAIADIDDGGDALTLYRTTKEFERAGLGAVHFGDGIAVAGRNTGLLSKSQMVDKIHAAADARSDMVVSVRLQGFNTEMMEKTLERGVAYAEAGADVLWFVPMPINDMPKAAAAVKIPLTAQIFFDQPMSLAKANKVTVAVYASFLQNIAQSAVYDALTELKTTGVLIKSSKGQRLGNTIPADFRAKMLRQAEHTERANKYNVGK